MLSREDNELLTQVGPGTPMGSLLRRYWVPACLSSELPDSGGAPIRVRLLCEDLVAFRDRDGNVGLVAENCPHRGASLYFGRNEVGDQCGLRCVYHGWLFDTSGQCTDMPSEPRPFADRIKAKAYPVQEAAGLVWTYMGPEDTMTPLPKYWQEGPKETEIAARKAFSDANWVQVMEGVLDTAHISFLHQFNEALEFPDDGTDKPGYPSNIMSWRIWAHDRSPRMEVEDTWYGFRYGGLRTTPNGHTHARVTSWIFPWATVVPFVPFTVSPGIAVPIDDEHTWRYSMARQPGFVNPAYIPPGSVFDVTPFRTTGVTFRSGTVGLGSVGTGLVGRDFTLENDYLIDRDVQRGTTFTGIVDFNSQDNMATESMGPIIRRWEEHLGTTDVAIIRMRTKLITAAKALAESGTMPQIAGSADDLQDIRGAEKILEEGEDWRALGTRLDQAVQDAEGLVGTD